MVSTVDVADADALVFLVVEADKMNGTANERNTYKNVVHEAHEQKPASSLIFITIH